MATVDSVANPGISQEVDGSFKAGRVAARPAEYQTFGSAQGRTYGHYALAAKSGAITGAAVVAGAPLFSFRWTDTASVHVLFKVKAVLDVTTIFTAVQEIGVDLLHVTSFSTSDSAGTPILSSAVTKMRSNMGPSLAGDIRIAAATLLTAGIRTLDLNPIALSISTERDTNAAAGTPFLPPALSPASTLLYQPNVANGEHPLVMGANEGFLIRNLVAFPAAGVVTLTVELSWLETPQY